jgi:hypothetical protein
VRKQG